MYTIVGVKFDSSSKIYDYLFSEKSNIDITVGDSAALFRGEGMRVYYTIKVASFKEVTKIPDHVTKFLVFSPGKYSKIKALSYPIPWIEKHTHEEMMEVLKKAYSKYNPEWDFSETTLIQTHSAYTKKYKLLYDTKYATPPENIDRDFEIWGKPPKEYPQLLGNVVFDRKFDLRNPHLIWPGHIPYKPEIEIIYSDGRRL